MDETTKRKRAPKGQAQWGNRPPGFYPKELFTDEIIQTLAGICHRKDEAPRLKELLSGKSDALQMVNYIKETEIQIKDQRAALRFLAKRARELHTKIGEADQNTRNVIFSTYLGVAREQDDQLDVPSNPNDRDWLFTEEQRETALMAPDDIPHLFVQNLGHFEHLTQSLEGAFQSLPRNDGAKPLSALHNACEIFAPVYERFSGERFTYERRRDAKQLSAFVTPGSYFVATACRFVIPDATIANLSTVMRKVKMNWKYQ